MTAASRIAVVWVSAAPAVGVTGTLSALSPAPTVQLFSDLIRDAAAIARFQPDIVLLAHDAPGPEETGALRLLRALVGDFAVIVAAPDATAEGARAIAARLGGVCLPLPPAADIVVNAIDAVLHAPTPSERGALFALTQGIADEVNNPLQVALGHLRLLEEDFAADAPQIPKVDAIRRSLQRIRGTLSRAQVLQRAHQRSEAFLPVELAALVVEVAPHSAPPRATVVGDADLLRQALRELMAVGRDLALANQAAELDLTVADGRATIRLQVATVKLAEWQLPRTFEPYYLGSLLRGTSHGLSTFTIQVVAEAHGGRAVARRRPDGGLVIEVQLPTR